MNTQTHLAQSDLSVLQKRAVEKIGDLLIPGGPDHPKFSELGCLCEIPRILNHMPADDRADLGLLLNLLGLLPSPLLKGILALLDRAYGEGWIASSPLGPTLRLIRLGLRGIVMSLYYGHPKTHDRLEYQVSVYTADQ